MNWNLDKNKPICPQICERICVMIATGELVPNQKLPTVRDLASSVHVNPNTVQKSFNILQGHGVIYSVPTLGWYVAEDLQYANKTLGEIISKKTSEYFAAMEILGYSKEKTKALIADWDI